LISDSGDVYPSSGTCISGPGMKKKREGEGKKKEKKRRRESTA
jgi:hypothetical protein